MTVRKLLKVVKSPRTDKDLDRFITRLEDLAKKTNEVKGRNKAYKYIRVRIKYIDEFDYARIIYSCFLLNFPYPNPAAKSSISLFQTIIEDIAKENKFILQRFEASQAIDTKDVMYEITLY